MAETQQTEEVQQTTYDVMSEALEELHKDDPVVEETPVETSEEVVDAQPESSAEPEPEQEQLAESDVKAPTYQEAEDAQQKSSIAEASAKAAEETISKSEADEGEALDIDDTAVIEGLKPKAQERFKYWIDRAKNIEQEYNSMVEGNTQLGEIIQNSTTNPQQLGWALEIFKGLNSGDYNVALNSLKAMDQFSDQVAKTLGVHGQNNEKASYGDFEDLSQAVENLEMSEDWANKLASQRVSQNSMNQAQVQFREQASQQQEYLRNHETQKETAFQQIETWEQDLTEKDPDYSLKKDIMIEMGTQLAQSDVPPDQWLPVLQNQYQMLSRGMGVAGGSKSNASRRSGPLAPSAGNSGTVNVTDLKTPEVTPEFLQAHLDAMHE